jgi:FkbM family methyltransferase
MDRTWPHVIVANVSAGYSIFVRAIKAVPGLGSLASRMQFLLPDRVVVREVDRLGSFAFRLRRHRWLLGAPLFASGHHAETLATFRAMIRPGDVVYDIGANIGYYARLMAREMSPGKVICFEPMRENAELLEMNVKLGKLNETIRVFRVALSDQAGDELLQIDDVMGGTAVLDRVSGGEAAEARKHVGLPPKTETVRVVRLDDLIRAEKLPPPNFVKIDTEGAEAMVLGGALATLRVHPPHPAIALHGEAASRKTIELLASLGYACRGKVDGTERIVTSADAGRLSDNNITARADIA